jgi:hypothetical protein
MGQGFSKSSLLSLARSFAWILELEASTLAESSSWNNKEMDPARAAPPHKRTWQALLANSLGHFILAVVIVLTGTIGARLGVPFTILARLSFEFWLSYISVISLIVLWMFWFGIQTYIGSECVYQVRRLLSHLLPRTQILFT